MIKEFFSISPNAAFSPVRGRIMPTLIGWASEIRGKEKQIREIHASIKVDHLNVFIMIASFFV